ncbi:hypothetical protein [Streptomyces sp. NPDC056188]|uniref:hypothetical protein n=1 Tax=Streptomyces sp. NPDC056188 TaxID=3345740 RepID=UPI0035D8AB38
MKWFQRRRPAPAWPRADRTQIALLEYELFGIEPEPNSAAALVLQLRRAFTQREAARHYVGPEFGHRDGGRRSPYLRQGD